VSTKSSAAACPREAVGVERVQVGLQDPACRIGQAVPPRILEEAAHGSTSEGRGSRGCTAVEHEVAPRQLERFGQSCRIVDENTFSRRDPVKGRAPPWPLSPHDVIEKSKDSMLSVSA